MRAMGIDIGTTTISIVLLDGDTGMLLDSRTLSHKSFVKGPTAASRVQDPAKILELTTELAKEMIKKHGRPNSIGMTGQMHGMLYVDCSGMAVSPLYTWQDGNGNELTKDGRTYAEIVSEAAGTAASGYGLTTHYYLQRKGLIPKTAEKMVTISDYIAMRLCESTEAVIARDMAASWGGYDLEIGDFCREELETLGVDSSYFPRILSGHSIMGTTAGSFPGGIPVSVSLGDNQASVLGTVRDLSNTVLVNIGTGSQVSFGAASFAEATGSIELRPYCDGLYLMAGSGLCGGRAYAMLEQFYREASGNPDPLYEFMERQAREFMEAYGKEAAWKIRTTFSGTRSNPKERGSISGIGAENFHPGAMTLGMLGGIVEELYEMYREMCGMAGSKAVQLVGSGNGLRRNALMRELVEERFRMPVKIPKYEEEAACGAAMQSLASAGFAGSVGEMQKNIRYLN